MYVPRFGVSSTHINQKKKRVDISDEVNAVAGMEVAAPFPPSVMGAAVDAGGLGSTLQQTLASPLRGQQNLPIPRS